MRKGMYLDSSAMISVLLQQPGWEDVSRRMDDHGGKLITSPVSFCETVAAIAGERPTSDAIAKASELVTDFMAEAGVQAVTISGAQTKAALDAWSEQFSTDQGPAPAITDMLILGVAKSFRCGLLSTGDRFPNA